MYVYVFVHLDIVDIVIFNPFIANVFVLSSLIQQKKHLWFSGLLRGFGTGSFARNGSITDMVYGM